MARLTKARFELAGWIFADVPNMTLRMTILDEAFEGANRNFWQADKERFEERSLWWWHDYGERTRGHFFLVLDEGEGSDISIHFLSERVRE